MNAVLGSLLTPSIPGSDLPAFLAFYPRTSVGLRTDGLDSGGACSGDINAVMTEALQGLRPQGDVVAELLRRTASPPIPQPGGVGGLSAQSLSPGWRA